MRKSQAGGPPNRTGDSCAYLAFESLDDSAHNIHILAMCDAFSTCGLDAQAYLHPANDGRTPSAADLRQAQGLINTPRIVWVPRDTNKWAARLRLFAHSVRAGQQSTYAYTRKALPALGALLGGAHHVFLEIHQPISALNERAAFSLARHSKRLHIVCISAQLAAMTARQYGIDASACIVEHTGHSFPVRGDYSRVSASGRRLSAMYVGTFAPGRGLETIFALAARHPAVDFVVVGGDTPVRHLPSNVSVRGRVPHATVPALLSEADILLMPYTRDTYLPDGQGGTAEYCSPLKMFEYLSAGRSIIASDLPSITEILKDGSNCLLADPESVPAWSEAMTRLENDVGLRTALASAATETARRHTIVGRVRRILERAGVSL